MEAVKVLNNSMIPYANVVRPITALIIHITREIAEEWLTYNIENNRFLKKGTVAPYAKDIENNHWGLNPDAIAFDMDGKLINGQHRLSAVVKTGKAIDALVVFDFPITKQDFLNIDTGAKRTTRDALMISGYDGTLESRASDIASAYLRIKYGEYGHGTLPKVDIIALTRDNPEIMEWACDIGRYKKTGGRGGRASTRIPAAYMIAMIDAKLCGESEDALQRFAQVYCDNNFDGTEAYSPRYAIELRESHAKRTHKLETVNAAKASINAFAHKLTKRYIRDNLYLAKRLEYNSVNEP